MSWFRRSWLISVTLTLLVAVLASCGETSSLKDSEMPRLGKLKPSGSLILGHGQAVEGLHIKCTGNKPAILIPPGVHGVTIRGNVIGPCAPGVVGILADESSHNINIHHNIIQGVATGLWARHALHPIRFDYNNAVDILGPFPRGQMVQFDHVFGGSGQSRISGNVSDWSARTRPTRYEDHISVYMSSGTEENPILIEGNKVRGGDSDSGAAIVIEGPDGAWFDIRNNIVVAVPNTGIGLAGGSHINVVGNRVFNVSGKSVRTASGMYTYNVRWVNLEKNQVIASDCVTGPCNLHPAFWQGPNSKDMTMTDNNWFDKTLDGRMWDSSWTGSSWR